MKFYHTIISVVILMVILLAGIHCTPGKIDPAQLRSEIVTANEKFMDAVSGGDAAGLAGLYTDDGMVMPSNADFIKGKEAIQGFLQGLIDMGIKGINLESSEVEGYGDTAIEVGTYALKDAEGQVLDKGKYIVVWKNVEGEWKLHRDIFNSSMPTKM